MNFDNILEKVGPFGRYQKIHWMTLSLVIVPCGIQNLMNIYIMATPPHWCHVIELANLSQAERRRLVAPPSESDPQRAGSLCAVPDVNYTEAYLGFLNNETGFLNATKTRECTQWDYDYSVYGTTGVTKWDLVCSKASLPATAQSIYMLGVLVGALIFGYISDRFGRKISMYISLVGVVAFALLSAAQQNLWAHIAFRTLAGVAACGCITIPFVMVMEMIGPDNRLIPGLFAQIFFALGYIILALVAYLARSFVLTNVIMSALPTVLLFYWWTETESVRWLLAQGRKEEASDILKNIAKTNRVAIDVDELIKDYSAQQAAISLGKSASSEKGKIKNYTILDIVRTPNMRKKSLNVLFNWFVTSMVYYGLSMGVTDLGGDPYLNLFISGFTECCSVVVACLTLDRLGRRLCEASVLILGGLACVTYGLLPPEHQTIGAVLAMVGKFGLSASFAIIYVFSAELFPTVVRTIGVGAGSMCGRFGGLVAPFVAEMKVLWLPLPNVVFGFCAITAGLLTLLLPETLREKLPDSLEDGEAFGRNVNAFDVCLRRRSREGREEDKEPDDTATGRL